MTDGKIFLKEIISASNAGDDKKCASLMAKRTSEHINRIHIEKYPQSRHRASLPPL